MFKKYVYLQIFKGCASADDSEYKWCINLNKININKNGQICY